MVLNKNAQREQGKVAQANNIKAAKAVADIVRTTLGPKSMLKMLLDPMGGIVLTNDGNAILREVRSRLFTNLIHFSRSMLLTLPPSP
jgi:T-complex protein 1 subunit gamma